MFISTPFSPARVLRTLATALTLTTIIGCSDTTLPERDFLLGTPDNAQIAMVVTSTGKAMHLFQLGAPTKTRYIPFGASSSITPVGFAYRKNRAVVPLGNAGSVALIDLTKDSITRFFTFPSGNATGAAFVDDTTILVANTSGNYIGKFTVGQAAGTITQTLAVPPTPTAIVMSGGRAYVVSGNLDDNFLPIGNSIVTVVNPANLSVVTTLTLGGTNSSAAAVGPNGRVYVVNTEDYVADGSVTIIDPATPSVIATVAGFGSGPGSIHVDADGLAYVSEFFAGTVVWNTSTQAFVRGPGNPVCAKRLQTAGTPCRGAFDATRASDGRVYQLFFGSASQGLLPYVFIYSANSYQLVDSVGTGVGPAAIEIGTFTP